MLAGMEQGFVTMDVGHCGVIEIASCVVSTNSTLKCCPLTNSVTRWHDPFCDLTHMWSYGYIDDQSYSTKMCH